MNQARFFILYVSVFLGLLLGCQTNTATDRTYSQLQGETMGTYYKITYYDSLGRTLQPGVDSLLAQLNQEVSTYIESSTISRFNQSEKGIALSYNPYGEDEPYENEHFKKNFAQAVSMYRATDGNLDATVMPLVNYWGFGYSEKRKVTRVDSNRIDSLLQFVGMDMVDMSSDSLRKKKPGVQLDFSALAKGYGVDLIGAFLANRGIQHFFVDIGGEVVVSGESSRGDDWRIGISDPRDNVSLEDIQTAIPITDRAMATSGNYRNVYEANGVKYSHTINPKTGYPERSSLLSATVLAVNCMQADALATACMVAGVDQAMEYAKNDNQIDVYLIIGLPDGSLDIRYSEGFNTYFDK
jgi:FAD:protein FMN transferase